MSAVRIPADPWPFRAHRTWREVLRTDELQRAPRRVAVSLDLLRELWALEAKARKHNPPDDETERRA